MLTEYIRDAIDGAKQDLRDWARETIRETIANLLTSTTIARASESDDDPLVHDIELWGSADDQSASNAEGGIRARPRARHVEAPCFAYVPLEGEPVKVAGLGANLLMWAVSSTRYRPTGVKKGEFAIYNLRAGAQQLVIKGDKDSACTITVGNFLHLEIDKDGQVKLTAKDGQEVRIDSGAGADLVLNGGTLRVARVTDPVAIGGDRLTLGTFAYHMEQVRLQIIAAGGGDVGDPPQNIGYINPTGGGADRTKA
jgi:hypothetical protein